MSQAGFSTHNVEVSLISATRLSHTICQHVEQHTLSQFLAHHNSSPQPAIFHFPFLPEVPGVWPQRFRSSWFRSPWQKRQTFFHFNHAVMGNETPLVPQGNILVRSCEKMETVFLQNSLFFLLHLIGVWLYLRTVAGVASFHDDTTGEGSYSTYHLVYLLFIPINLFPFLSFWLSPDICWCNFPFLLHSVICQRRNKYIQFIMQNKYGTERRCRWVSEIAWNSLHKVRLQRENARALMEGDVPESPHGLAKCDMCQICRLLVSHTI